jgi:hypothetical protein
MGEFPFAGRSDAVRQLEERTMTTETDAWQVAWILAEQYGAEGVHFAANMAHSFQIGGKIDEQKAWLSVMEKVDTLTSEESSSAATLQ